MSERLCRVDVGHASSVLTPRTQVNNSTVTVAGRQNAELGDQVDDSFHD